LLTKSTKEYKKNNNKGINKTALTLCIIHLFKA